MDYIDLCKTGGKSPPRKNPHAKLVGRDIVPLSHHKTAIKGEVIDEDKLRQQLGVAKPENKTNLPQSYRALFRLDTSDILDFFDVQINEREEFVQVDFAVPASMLEHRVNRLKRVIAASRAVIDGMASRVIKIRRGSDDPLLDDKAAREKYKRDENARITRCNMLLFRYRAALKAGNYRERVWRWVKKPVYFRDVVDDRIVFPTVTDTRWTETDELFTGGLQTHERVELIEYLRVGVVDSWSYRMVMTLGEAALVELGETEAAQKERWRLIQQWENSIISSAVRYRLIIPSLEIAELLGLRPVLDEDDLPYVGGDEENQLAIKTGGACYGGHIRSEGGGRRLTSFDKPMRRWERDSDGGAYHDSGFQNFNDRSDDAESYDLR